MTVPDLVEFIDLPDGRLRELAVACRVQLTDAELATLRQRYPERSDLWTAVAAVRVPPSSPPPAPAPEVAPTPTPPPAPPAVASGTPAPNAPASKKGGKTALWILAGVGAAGGGAAAALGGGRRSSPISATTAAPTPTRIINITGNLTFGRVTIGSQSSVSFTISNSGNATMTVTGITATSGFTAHSFVSWSSGTIAAGGSQNVIVTFRPTAAGTFSGSITISADHTSGTNTIAFTATSVEAELFPGTWSGNYIVEQCLGTGSVQDILCSAPSGPRPGGLFPVGTALPIRLTLTQSGASVSGTVAFGNATGPVSGTVVNGNLTLSGTARADTLTIVISQWSSQVSGNTMNGNATLNVTLSSLPGSGNMVVRLSNVNR